VPLFKNNPVKVRVSKLKDFLNHKRVQYFALKVCFDQDSNLLSKSCSHVSHRCVLQMSIPAFWHILRPLSLSLSFYDYRAVDHCQSGRTRAEQGPFALSSLPAWGICILSEPATSQRTALRNKFLVVHGAREISPFWPPPALSLFISTGHRTHPLHVPKVKLEPKWPWLSLL